MTTIWNRVLEKEMAVHIVKKVSCHLTLSKDAPYSIRNLFHYGLPNNAVGGSDNIALRAGAEQQLNWREMKRS
jgi:nucleoside diphosphate kinase